MKRNILGGKENSCMNCGGTMVHIKVKGLGVVSQCKECGNLVNGRIKDTVQIYSYNPIASNGNCKIKSNKSQELKKHLALDFGRGKKFSYKFISDNIATVYKKGIIFYVTKNQLEEYFDIY